MSDNRFQKPIYFKEDLDLMYANSRKALEKEDVEDLTRCLGLWLKKNGNKKRTITFPSVGTAFKKLNSIYDIENPFYAENISDYFFKNKNIIRPNIFESHAKTKEELQEFQNENFEDN